MSRLYIFCEGQTEEAFIKEVVAPHLIAHGIYSTIPILSGGFWKTWARLMWSLLREHKGPEVRFTTLFDLYGLPRGFPEIAELMKIDTRARAEAVERTLATTFADDRLIPYVQLHEFEALVLAGLDDAGWIFDAPGDAKGLAALRADIEGLAPEEINDGATTAPSKRLEARIPGYDKILHGQMVTSHAGLATLRDRCPRFAAWLTRLESLTKVA